ncbi:hypothetical protein Q9L58_002248 [Maublancomyces gigas]|uniref:Zn(2)-C6 fungal-type domain-containing protein n=1 Tax=Discina gigas TaxID=1032678 RepID=A0ABR3GS05_9PEZI
MSNSSSSSSQSSSTRRKVHPNQLDQGTYDQGVEIGLSVGFHQGYQAALKGFLDTATTMQGIHRLPGMTTRNHSNILGGATVQSDAAGIDIATILRAAVEEAAAVAVHATVPNPVDIVETTTTTVGTTNLKRAPIKEWARVRVSTTAGPATAVHATTAEPTTATTVKTPAALKPATIVTPATATTVKTPADLKPVTTVTPATTAAHTIPKITPEGSKVSGSPEGDDAEPSDEQIVSECVQKIITGCRIVSVPLLSYFSRHHPPPSNSTRPSKRVKLSSPSHINWLIAMEETGKRQAVTRGMYMAGDVKVGGQSSRTKPRHTPCVRCKRVGATCIVLDARNERNLNTKSCSYCMRRGIACYS